ncbi:hypothetical protein NSE01_09430 [Novosphingobium sediminis]|uniref:Uncharacterized protein n=1 Tax=Novosphingobium sediminis TaxID=707214 RepID=A0A512AHC7_9SPHN|nr:hypothetical protein NSE01_09430 [Novosphingobium sediminis]
MTRRQYHSFEQRTQANFGAGVSPPPSPSRMREGSNKALLLPYRMREGLGVGGALKLT